MNDKILIGNIGKIIQGDDAGDFIQILDDSENTGGYLILQSAVQNFTSGSDSWVQDLDALKRYFVESEWEIEWL